MLVALGPAALVGLSVCVVHHPEAVALAEPVLALVGTAVGPKVLSLPVFFIGLPLPIVTLPILGLHGALALEPVVLEGSFEDAALLHEDSLAVPAEVEELPVVAAAVCVSGLALAVGHVVFPQSLVLEARAVEVLAVAVGDVVAEIALVVAAVVLDVASPALAATVNEFALEVVAVVVLDGSEALGLAGLCFPHIGALEGLEVDTLVVFEPRFGDVAHVRQLRQP
jgi:hypothetical protein